MKYFLFLLALLTISGCAKSYNGVYYDSCTLHHRPSVSLWLNSDNKFLYNFIYSETPIKGTWRRSHDTITLSSKAFLLLKEELTPRIKYSEGDSVDRFLSVGKKLIPIVSSKGAAQGCYLKKQ